MLFKVYQSIKPLLIFLLSLCSTLFLKNPLNTYSPFKDNDNSLSFWIGFFILIFSPIFTLIELHFSALKSKFNICILDENQLNGNTPLYLNNEISYKTIYLSVDISKLSDMLLTHDDSLQVLFPKGITSELNENDTFSKKENEVIIFFENHNLMNNGKVSIPINIAVAPSDVIEHAPIIVNVNIKKCKFLLKYFTQIKIELRTITVKRT